MSRPNPCSPKHTTIASTILALNTAFAAFIVADLSGFVAIFHEPGKKNLKFSLGMLFLCLGVYGLLLCVYCVCILWRESRRRIWAQNKVARPGVGRSREEVERAAEEEGVVVELDGVVGRA
jgi:hypothetical protein